RAAQAATKRTSAPITEANQTFLEFQRLGDMMKRAAREIASPVFCSDPEFYPQLKLLWGWSNLPHSRAGSFG
ncbi:MAG: hypothetical protein ACXWKY_05320, partial [Caulobacteraceae bacterium]